MKGVKRIKTGLDEIEPVAVRGTWFSITTFESLCKNDPPDWLYTSGEPNRFNPPKILCVYFARDEQTAKAEYEKAADENGGDQQPIVTYLAEIRLKRVLDLTKASIRKKLKLTHADLFNEWRCDGEYITQRLGRAVQSHPNFCAIRFPSAAAHHASFHGENLVIFRNRLKRGESIKILGPNRTTLQKWP